MTDASPAADRLLWYEQLDTPVDIRHADSLGEQLRLNVLALGDPDEWVLGHRFVGTPTLREATVLYLTRRRHSPGVRFELRTTSADPPDTTKLHGLVKQYIQEFTPAPDATPSSSLTVVDYHALRPVIGTQDLALARATHVSQRLEVPLPEGVVAGLMSGPVQLEMSFHSGDTVDLTVALAHNDLADEGAVPRLRVRAAIGDRSVVGNFTPHGIATIRNLDADSRTDLLHLTFEVKP